MTRTIALSAIHKTAKGRPLGYVEEVLSRGTVTEHAVIFDDDVYAELVQKFRNTTREEVPDGPGTELKALLSKIGITASTTCSCNARARTMNEREAAEPGWCEANLETICDWLQEEATKRKLPFVRMAARLLVRRAVANAKRKSTLTP